MAIVARVPEFRQKVPVDRRAALPGLTRSDPEEEWSAGSSDKRESDVPDVGIWLTLPGGIAVAGERRLSDGRRERHHALDQ